jgi:hypothetical protein
MERKLKEEQLLQNYQRLLDVAKREFSPERYEKVKALFDALEERMIFAPASSYLHYHNCFIGGYVEHVLNVINAAEHVHRLWEAMGGTTDYTREEMVFAAMFHDLGKLGNETMSFYVPETSDWHRKTLARMYAVNNELPVMNTTDQTLRMLAKFGIELSQNEWYGIKLADGLYNKANEEYLIIRDKDQSLHTNLHVTIHHADLMAAQIEKQRYVGLVPKFTTVPPVGEAESNSPTGWLGGAPEQTATDLDLDFDDLFGEAK